MDLSGGLLGGLLELLGGHREDFRREHLFDVWN
jgi:hypothetical protein